MIINYAKAAYKPVLIQTTIDLSNVDTSDNITLKKVKAVDVEIETSYEDGILTVFVYGHTIVEVECAYTLKIFEQKYDLDDQLHFTRDFDQVSDDIFYEKGPDIELDDYIYGLILGTVPLKVIYPGAKLAEVKQDNVRVMSEDEFIEEINKD